MTELLGTSPVALAAALLAGAALGALFFGGLWWTVARLPRAAHPVGLFALSALVRALVAAGGFLLVMQGSWERALACLAGFVLARALVRRRVARAGAEEVGDAAHP